MHFIFSTSERQQATLCGETPSSRQERLKTPRNGLGKHFSAYEISRSMFYFIILFYSSALVLFTIFLIGSRK